MFLCPVCLSLQPASVFQCPHRPEEAIGERSSLGAEDVMSSLGVGPGSSGLLSISEEEELTGSRPCWRKWEAWELFSEETGKGEGRLGGLSLQPRGAPLGPEISVTTLLSSLRKCVGFLSPFRLASFLSPQASLWKGTVVHSTSTALSWTLVWSICPRKTDRLTGGQTYVHCHKFHSTLPNT